LDDDDAEVRFQTAAALRRLTGQDHGRPPEGWRSSLADCRPTVAIWQTWWRSNERRYPMPEFAKDVPVPKGVTKKS
jgi:hypothetical protein